MDAVIFLSIFTLVGIVLVIGAARKWVWLIDPPKDKWWSGIYSQVGVKTYFGRDGTVVFTYFIGAVFIIIGIIGLVSVATGNSDS